MGRPNPNPNPKPKPKPKCHSPHTTSDLSSLLHLLTTSTTHTFRFLSTTSHHLTPTQLLHLSSLLATLSRLLPDPPSSSDPPSLPRVLSLPPSDPRWLGTFHLSHSSFLLLRDSLSLPDLHLAAALFRLAHAAPFPTVAFLFNLDSPADACKAFYAFCRGVLRCLAVKEDSDGVGFCSESFPGCGGVVAYRRFFVGRSGEDECGCVIAQAVVRGDRRFVDVSAGWSGGMRPAEILVKSKLFKENLSGLLGIPVEMTEGIGCRYEVSTEALKDDLMDSVECRVKSAQIGLQTEHFEGNSNNGNVFGVKTTAILPKDKLLNANISNVVEFGAEPKTIVPARYLLGDSCCPLLPWLMTPFDDPKTPSARSFNKAHSRVMEVVEDAFQGLIGRWKLLGVRWAEETADALPFVIMTGCLLQNFLLKCGDRMPAVDVEDFRLEQRFVRFSGEVDQRGEEVRQALASEMRSRKGHFF